MAKKTVEFKRLDLKKNAKDVEYRELKGIFNKIFEEKCVDNGKYRSLDLSPDIQPESVEPKKILDLFEDGAFLFGRVCKKKSRNALLRRDYETLKAEEVFNDTDSLKKGIEVFTFFILDYTKGILAIANAKDAPGATILNNILQNYCPEYTIEFTDIPNENGVNALYNSTNPELTKVEFEITRPDIEYLLRVVGLNEESVLEIVNDKTILANVTIKAQPYKKLETDQNKIKKVIDILKSKKDEYNKVVVTGRSDDFNSRGFDLHAKYFTYPIDVKNYEYKKGKKVEYTLDEITEEFKTGLHDAYGGNYQMLIALADRA